LDPGYGRFAIGVKQLCAAADDSGVLLVYTGEKPGDIHECHQGDVERVAGADVPGGLLGRVDVECAS
jgi:hypothetical protein